MLELNRSILNKKFSGFTLLELLVVVALIGILSAVILASLGETRESAYEARAKAEIRSFATALQITITFLNL